MNDLNQMTTQVLQDWWERYVCPSCLSKHRDAAGICGNPWHSVPAVTYECAGSAFSPLSIPVTELQQVGPLGAPTVAKYGLVWTPAAIGRRPERKTLGFV
ncbi:hypothetical protein [Naasia sp. SYSU D00948]|uniref:hypothetical protein n=1 Tax=Naasia sp. SYSU D00948 TaxID=2817379 RepID=UPI001B3024E5|nr:hypothetical protein [Naasia sp. SYSU D00948]